MKLWDFFAFLGDKIDTTEIWKLSLAPSLKKKKKSIAQNNPQILKLRIVFVNVKVICEL